LGFAGGPEELGEYKRSPHFRRFSLKKKRNNILESYDFRAYLDQLYSLKREILLKPKLGLRWIVEKSAGLKVEQENDVISVEIQSGNFNEKLNGSYFGNCFLFLFCDFQC